MLVTLDAVGRLVIPREIRREAALEPDMQPVDRVAPLRAATVERTRRQVARPRRRERR